MAGFEKFGVFTRAELESRAEIQYEAYSKAINIEARSMIDIASKTDKIFFQRSYIESLAGAKILEKERLNLGSRRARRRLQWKEKLHA